MQKFSYSHLMVGLVGALLLIGCENSKTNGQQSVSSQSPPPSKQVVLTEYSDFECPYCAYYYPIVKKLKQHYGDKLYVKYRSFPLNSHQFSMLAARAAQAAANQQKYLAMHDMLFKNQRKWANSGNPQPTFINYAKKIGLDVAQFKDDLNAAETQKIVIEQKKEGEKRGVSSTPTFFINGQKADPSPRTYKAFEALLDEFMNDSKPKN